MLLLFYSIGSELAHQTGVTARESRFAQGRIRTLKQRWRCEGEEVEALQLKGDKAAAAQEDNT